ncbi:hypothetical protein ZWY2020_050162 [Hordeum vulgare]|nr:hypothetical protein ZWY2020_050162 [Hordeum vulgare]
MRKTVGEGGGELWLAFGGREGSRNSRRAREQERDDDGRGPRVGGGGVDKVAGPLAGPGARLSGAAGGLTGGACRDGLPAFGRTVTGGGADDVCVCVVAFAVCMFARCLTWETFPAPAKRRCCRSVCRLDIFF